MNTCNVKIFETKGKKRTWFHELLEDYEIPFRVELESYVEQTRSGPQRKEKQCFYVPAAFEEVLKDMIDQYYRPDSIAWETNGFELEDEGVIAQITCPVCGKEYDFDYPRCPYCRGKKRGK